MDNINEAMEKLSVVELRKIRETVAELIRNKNAEAKEAKAKAKAEREEKFAKILKVGDNIEVEYKKEVFPATVIRVASQSVFVDIPDVGKSIYRKYWQVVDVVDSTEAEPEAEAV